MEKIYLVTSGSYSDYHIDGVFDNEILANKFINSFKADGYNAMSIEVFELNPFKLYINKGFRPFFVRMSKDGVCTEIYIDTSSYGYSGGLHHGFDIHKNMYIHVFARDEKHAIKIANEKRTELIALNEWK